METRVLPAGDEAIRLAAETLRRGQAVGMPTETVYGLAASAFDEAAVRGIFLAKGRPQDNPLIVHIADIEALGTVAGEIPPQALLLARAFWPGPLTMVLPRGPRLAPQVSAGLGTVGVRLPAHDTARRLIEATGFPLAAPSANISGSPSPTTAAHVLADLGGKIPLILDGGACPVGVESTVVSLQGPPTVLRPGFVTAREIEEVLGRRVLLAPSITAPLPEGAQPQSPGMKYRHYAPRADVTIVCAKDAAGFAAYVAGRTDAPPPVYALCFAGEEGLMPGPCVAYGKKGDAVSQAAGLFSALRVLDEKGAGTVFARQPDAGGVGLAVRNRLLRAAAFREITV